MSPGKTPSSGALGEPIEDVKLIRSFMDILKAQQTEFPIKVEGARTLPYASLVQEVDHGRGQFLVKLVRPLPHELLKGAQFRMVFAVEEQRFEGLITFLERDSYLQYRFQMPSTIQYSDRRRQRRHAFRPREKTFVTGLDGGIPGVGIAGPLANLSVAGCAIRLDRVLRMSDGMRIPINTGLFEKGKYFVQLRIQDLLRLPAFNLSGYVAHLTERPDGVILGLAFAEPSATDEKLIHDALEQRERMFRTTPGVGAPRSEGTAPAARTKGAREEAPPPDADEPIPHPPPSPLLLLQRHASRIVVVVPAGPTRQALEALLARTGFHRPLFVEDLPGAAEHISACPPLLRPQAVVVDLGVGGAESSEPLALLRGVQKSLQAFKNLRLYCLCPEIEPSLALEQSADYRFGTLSPQDEAAWAAHLDDLLELAERESDLPGEGDPDGAVEGVQAE